MKNLNELTEQEILRLSDEQVENLVRLKKAEEGIKLLEKPVPPEIKKIKEPETTVYTCALLGDNIAFSDIEKLKKVIELIEGGKFCSLEVDHNLPKETCRKYIASKIRTVSFRSEPWKTVKSEVVYTNSYYKEIKSVLSSNNKLEGDYSEQKEEYEAAIKEAEWVEDEIYNKIKEVRKKYWELDEYCRKFRVDYLPISEDNEEMAIKFMNKAYSLTDEQQKYILKNYKKK